MLYRFKALLLTGVLSFLAIVLSVPAAQAENCTLSAIVWEGYTDSSFAQTFEQQTGCAVKATYAGSSDEMFAKFRTGKGRNYDIISASGDITERLYRAGLVQPIDPSKLKNYDSVFSSFRGGNWNTFDGTPYGVTFAWGPNVMVYNKEKVSSEPKSWDVLFDPQYAGKISLPDNPMTIADVALWLGKPDPYHLSEQDLAEVKAKLLELRPQVRKFWTTAGELANLFQSGEVVIAHAWPLTYTQLSSEGFPAGTVSPEGKLTGWTDSWMISKNSRHEDAAYEWVDFILSGEGQKGVMDVTGYSGATELGAEAIGKDRAHALFMDDLSLHRQIKMWQSVPNYDQWVQVWNEVRS
ncbi:ABC transporter substrate-binding protein [Leptolyngbya sp. FACHB-711]|uniref:ABC transporter substrate-binding protein n=1 Tax=unclassified Leptolyngbya TaxID=2650499 RepID=UPI00168A1562|nr:ABC transporter substrate-binding protein [Leptolyngbya sp. FACHB-711]MBD1848767.1 ABC transporter substrate-binding protein [Cyanobacteria bacterium FACHB-502]MBD2026850.1 ABC transporter substrate-binding protein [Leptolyngbya sp. FACHB-711]